MNTLGKNLEKGFTLIEMIISLSILSTLAIIITSSMSNALKAKKKIQTEVEDVASLRDTMKMIRSDIQQAYHHYDFEKEILDKATAPSKPPNSPPGSPPGSLPSTTQQPQRENKRMDPKTDFVGDEKTISFVTMNNGRLLANEIQADFVEVGYSLKSCHNLSKPDQTSSCLFRRVQKVIDDDVTTGGTETVILENINEFKLRYIGEGKQDWANSWKTSGGIESVMADKFPDAVEVTISIEREFEGKKRKYSLLYVVPLHFPNNSSTKKNQTANGGITQ